MKRRFFLRIALPFVLLGLLAPALLAAADLKYLTRGTPDAVKLLPAPPALGSDEQAADLATVRNVCAARTAAQEAAFKAQVELSIFDFSDIIGTWFREGLSPKTEELFKFVEADTRKVTNAGKKFWNRPRPYLTDTSIKALEPEKSASYPSGHSTRGTVFTLILAELFPQHREALLLAGRNSGWLRITGGVHYPTDIFGGRVLGQAIVQEMLKNPQFQADLAAAKAELAAAKPQAAPLSAAAK